MKEGLPQDGEHPSTLQKMPDRYNPLISSTAGKRQIQAVFSPRRSSIRNEALHGKAVVVMFQAFYGIKNLNCLTNIGRAKFFSYLCHGLNKKGHRQHFTLHTMRNILLLASIACLYACQPSPDKAAEPAMQRIDSLYRNHQYAATLSAIRQLRADHPKAVECRKRALKIWQEASVKMAQADIARTDSALQATLQQIDQEHDLYRQNMLRARRDSLQIRYDALCGTVRVIHQRQQE